MRIKALSLGPYATNCYIAEDDGRAVIIDAPYPADAVIDELRESSLVPESVLLTHGHHDHVFGLERIREAFPDIRIYAAEEDMPYLENNGEGIRKMLLSFDKSFLKSVENVSIPGDIKPYSSYSGEFSVISTPGHTAGSVVLYSKKENAAFTGDTLFQGGVGRTDIGGNYSELMSSLDNLSALPDSTYILPGHGGVSTIGNEKRTNPYMMR